MLDYNDTSGNFSAFIKGAIDDKKKRHACYEETCEHADEMSVHVYGRKPTRLLNITRPNEPAEITAYRLNVYQPKTKSTTKKALGVLSKIFNPSFSSIKWIDQDNNGKLLQDHALVNYPVYNSVVVYLQEAVVPKMIADPNAVMAIKPLRLTIPDTDRVEPIAVMYGSENIWHLDTKSCLVLLKIYDDKVRNISNIHVFEFYDEYKIVVFDAFKQNNGLVIEEKESYTHNIYELPVWRLRGESFALDNGEIIFKSFFDAAVPYWNDAIGHESDLKGAFQNHIHPLRYEYAEKCAHVQDGQRCNSGSIKMPTGESMQCPSCGGSGFKQSANSPFKTIIINRDKVAGLDPNNNSFPVPAGFITVPTEPTDLLDQYVDKQHKRGLEALNMDILDRVGENQSGVAKVIDRGELYDFLSRISTIVFDVHLQNIFYYFNAMMFNVSSTAEQIDQTKLSKSLPVIVKPYQFDISSTYELITQLSEAKKAGLSESFLLAAQHEIIEKKFHDPEEKQFMEMVLELDPIPNYTPDEVNMLASQGVYRKADVIVHFQIAQLIMRALNDDKSKFLNADKQGKKDILYGYAKEIESQAKVKIEPKPPTPV